MQQFMVEITLPDSATANYMHLIPQQRSYVESLFKRGIIVSYTLALDRSKLWVVLIRASRQETEAVIRKFPIAAHITYAIHPLTFHNSVSTMLPTVSLN